MTPGILAAFAGFFLFLVGHVLLFQLFTIRRRFQAMVALWAALLAAYGILCVVFHRHLPAAFVSSEPVVQVVGVLNGVAIYLLMFLVYLCIYFTDHSLSVAFMIELEHRPGRRMTREELKQRFPHDAMLRQRFADLEANHYVIREGDSYRLAPKGKLFVATLGSMKRFLKLEPGG